MARTMGRDEEERATKRRPYEHAAGEDKARSLAAHRARCSICKHPERKEIEREFLDWVSPREIAENWKLPSYRAVYRHAHAVGLFERRRENRLTALEAIIERVREVPVTAAAVVAAIRLSLKLEHESGETGRRPEEPKFLLSLEGLPRTNAVTGVAPDDESGLQCAPTDSWQEGGETAGLRGAQASAGQPRGSSLPGTMRREQGWEDSDSVRGEGHEVKAEPTAEIADAGLEISEPMRATHAPLRTEEGHRLKPMPPGRRDAGPANGGGASADLSEATADVAAQGTQAVAREPDPRIVLGEDGRVAGIPWPWPKQKIAFARVGRRWRRRGP